jgi:hypothetical protein
MLSNAFASDSNGPGTTTSTHAARCQEGALPARSVEHVAAIATGTGEDGSIRGH